MTNEQLEYCYSVSEKLRRKWMNRCIWNTGLLMVCIVVIVIMACQMALRPNAYDPNYKAVFHVEDGTK